MKDTRLIRNALISVYNKDGLADVVRKLDELGVKIISTGGTYTYIEKLGIEAKKVEDLTGYPSILGGRVKTLHPKVFGGILARNQADDKAELEKFEIDPIDLVIVDLYPFEETVSNTNDEAVIIEKIDIGGIALIRAASKNFRETLIVSEMDQYPALLSHLNQEGSQTDLEMRKRYAANAFDVSSHYDTQIYKYMSREVETPSLKVSERSSKTLRYGENPHQQGLFYGRLSDQLEQLSGKELSYNNLLDIDAGLHIIEEFDGSDPTFAVIKHNNTCGLSTRKTVLEAWEAALAGDPVSAFGGILISNSEIDLATAEKINELFYEVLIAPSFDQPAFDLLRKKKKRVLLKNSMKSLPDSIIRTSVNGILFQEADTMLKEIEDYKCVTDVQPTTDQLVDLHFAVKAVKHLKSNTITLVKGQQLLGMGCGQTSRVDALNQAISKARNFGFSLEGSVMASDAFFPFPDCVEIAHKAGIRAIVQPGGSIKDQQSIDYCNQHQLPMVLTGIRHFKH